MTGAVLRVENLTCGYAGNTVLRDVTFGLAAGGMAAVIGPNGAGKSTLLKAISRVIKPLSGSVFFKDSDVHKANSAFIARNIAAVTQNSTPGFSFSVLDVVLMGRIPHTFGFRDYGQKDLAVAHDCLKLTDSLCLADRPIDRISAGERQRVIIAKALAQQPELLLLDEPTAHLDIGHQIQIMDLLKRLNGSGGLAILLVLHDLNLAAEYCNNLILLDKGRIVAQGEPARVLRYEIIERVYNTTVVVSENPHSKKPYVFLAGKG